jgi:hypothetical protein
MLLASVVRRGPLWHLARGVRRDQVTDDLPAPVFGKVTPVRIGGEGSFLPEGFQSGRDSPGSSTRALA